MNAWHALRAGLARTTRYWQVWLILYAANLLGALLLVFLPALTLVSEPGHRPAIRQAADGLDAWLVLETLMSPDATAALGQGGPEPSLTPDLQQALLVALITLVALPWLAWLPASFLTGGLLLTYAGDPQRRSDWGPQPFRWRRFLWGCWHWFGTFLLLGLVQAFGWLIGLIPGVFLIVAALSVGQWLVWLLVAGLGLWLAFWLVLLEYARVAAVVGDTKNAVRALGSGLRFIVRHLLPVAGLYTLSLLLAAALHALFRLGLMPYLRLDWWLLVLLVQQVFILARLGIRLVRLGGETALVMGASQAPPVQEPVGPPTPEPS